MRTPNTKLKLTIMEVELEMSNHDLDDLLRVLGKPFLQFSSIADQHATRGCFFFETGCPDAETLLCGTHMASYHHVIDIGVLLNNSKR